MQDYRLSFHITGLFGCIFSLLMFIPAAVEYFTGMVNFDVFMNSAFFGLFVSLLIVVTSYTEEAAISHRSSFLATTLVWFVITFITAVPLYFARYPGYSISIIDALLESSSGITTTGLSILGNLENISKGVLLWRAMLQFFGGVGIITLVFIVMPYLQNGAMYFFLTESSENQEKETPRILDFALLILAIYTVFATLCACCYYFFGMNAFDAICHSMATVSSGGFGTHDSSFAFFKSPALETIAICFMIISGVPFIMIVRLFTRRMLIFSSQVSIMLYMFVILTFLLFLVYDILGNKIVTIHHFRHLLFAVVSLGTSTGFSSVDLSSYGSFLTMTLIIVSVIGGCTGSTSGGIKIFRIQVVYKMIKRHFLKIVYPHIITKVKCDDQEISENIIMSAIILIFLYATFSVITIFIMTAFGFTLSDAISTTVTALSNGGIIASEYGTSASILLHFPETIKAILTVNMILGRLEFIAVLVIIAQIFKRV